MLAWYNPKINHDIRFTFFFLEISKASIDLVFLCIPLFMDQNHFFFKILTIYNDMFFTRFVPVSGSLISMNSMVHIS